MEIAILFVLETNKVLIYLQYNVKTNLNLFEN